MAEMLFRNELRKYKRKDISVSSAGLYAYPGNPPDPKMVDYLRNKGVHFKRPGARQLTGEDLNWADLILVMERDHAIMIRESWPEVVKKVELFGNYIAEDQRPDDIVDPFGKPSYYYHVTQTQIRLGLKNLLKRLAQERTETHRAKNQNYGG